MIPGPFVYHRPQSVAEVNALLSQFGDEARVLAGGHSLIPMMKLRMATPEHLVDLGAIAELKGIKRDAQMLTIGALTTQAELIGSDVIASSAPIIREASLLIADPQVRYMGTLGGNVANGDPGNDMPAIMMVLNATYRLAGSGGARRVAARDFYLGAYATALQTGEILHSIEIPIPAVGHGYAYEKLKRKIGDYATAAAAVMMTASSGKIATSAIALTNLADVPIYCHEASQAVVSSALDSATLVKAARFAANLMSPSEVFSRARRVPRKRGRCHAHPRTSTSVCSSQSLSLETGTTPMPKHHLRLRVNGRDVEGLVEPRTLLIHFIRDHLGLTGSHIGCDTSHCGACTVDLNGKSVKSCTMLAVQAEGADVTTIEGMAAADGTLHALQEGFRMMHGLQCGFCTPGMIMRAHRLLKENPNPTEEQIRFGISGNLCRCTGYQNIVKAIQYAAAKLGGREFVEAAE